MTPNHIRKSKIITTISCGDLEQIIDPILFFKEGCDDFLEIVRMVRAAFGTEMTEEDIYNHLTQPERVYILRAGNRILAMGSYTPKNIDGNDLLFVDGVAIHPSMQGKGLFGEITSYALKNERLLGLKTQNPRMHRALERFCDYVCPFTNCTLSCPEINSTNLFKIREGLARSLGHKIDRLGVIRGFYGRSLHPNEPTNTSSSRLFNEVLGVNYQQGDSVVCVGVKNER